MSIKESQSKLIERAEELLNIVVQLGNRHDIEQLNENIQVTDYSHMKSSDLCTPPPHVTSCGPLELDMHQNPSLDLNSISYYPKILEKMNARVF